MLLGNINLAGLLLFCKASFVSLGNICVSRLYKYYLVTKMLFGNSIAVDILVARKPCEYSSIPLQTRKQTHRLANRHEGPLKW